MINIEFLRVPFPEWGHEGGQIRKTKFASCESILFQWLLTQNTNYGTL